MPRRKTVRVAAVQMPFGARVEENLAAMRACLARLARRRVELVVFPECSLSGYLVPPARRNWKKIAAGVEELRALAREKKMAIIFGSAEPRGSGKPWNTAYAVDRTGRIVSRYRKSHLIDYERGHFSPGTEAPEVFSLCGLRVVMQICFDVRFPEPVRLAALAGAELAAWLFAAAGKNAWKVPVMEGHLRSRAAENGLYVVAANKADRIMMMFSRILDPDGLDLAVAGLGRREELVASIDPAEAHHEFLGIRRKDLYSLTRRRQ